jgi:hypothetical protein
MVMPKRSRKPDPDPNIAARDTVLRITNKPQVEQKKNPAAVALGRLGGKKGGKARAEKLTPEQRSDIARKAASVRWERSAPDLDVTE